MKIKVRVAMQFHGDVVVEIDVPPGTDRDAVMEQGRIEASSEKITEFEIYEGNLLSVSGPVGTDEDEKYIYPDGSGDWHPEISS